MNNAEFHPRILSLTSPFNSANPSRANSITSPPFSQTPAEQSRRASHESAHDAHHFINEQEKKTQKSLNQSIKKMWKEVKHAAVEHHRSVNAAYAVAYGAGTRNLGAGNR